MESLIRTSHLFKSLDEAGRKRILECGFVIRHPADAKIMSQDDGHTHMYIVLSGTVRVDVTSAHTKITLADLSRGACFGEVAVISGGHRTANVTSLTDVALARFEREDILRIIADYPGMREVLMRLVEERATDAASKLIGQ